MIVLMISMCCWLKVLVSIFFYRLVMIMGISEMLFMSEIVKVDWVRL